MMASRDVVALVLAGGVGSRLHPLTKDRAKPAVPFGGKYRIIDFTLSNCFHSGIRRILVLTQYKSHSLQMHLRDGWSILNPNIGEYVTSVPPQKRTGESWYTGTADAVYQNLFLLERSGADRVLILSGDHIYRMDYAAMLEDCLKKNAEVGVACMKVPVAEASSFGIVSVDENDRILGFDEKPAKPKCIPGKTDQALASMGVYVFDRELLCRVLKDDATRAGSSHDFGYDLLPRLVQTQAVYAYRFASSRGRVSVDGYWRDVGTIDGYYRANMDLLEATPPLDLYQPDWRIRTAESQSPPARAVSGASGRKANVENVIFGAGSIIRGASVRHSILSRNVVLEEAATVENAILLEDVKVGPGAMLKNCIIDKNVRVPAGTAIGHDSPLDRKRFTLSDSGIVVVRKGYQFSANHRNRGVDDDTVVMADTSALDDTVDMDTEFASRHAEGSQPEK